MSELVLREGNIEKILEADGVYASVTEGVSMRPLFKTHRDMIVVKKVDKPLKKYDVALYKVGAKYILHRVVGIDRERDVYIIRGDNTYANEYIPKACILAVLVSFNRKGKRHDVTELGYRTYSRVWNFIYPIRFVIHKVLSFAKRVVKKILRKKSDEA